MISRETLSFFVLAFYAGSLAVWKSTKFIRTTKLKQAHRPYRSNPITKRFQWKAQ